MSECEEKRLNAVAADSWYLQPANKATIEYSSKLIKRFSWRSSPRNGSSRGGHELGIS